MSKKDACYANGWCSGAVRPRLMDGPLEVTSGTGWSGFGAKNRRAATPGWANVRGRKEQKTDLEKKFASDAAPARACAAHLYALSKSCVSKCAWEPTYVRGGYRIAVKLQKGGGGAVR